MSGLREVAQGLDTAGVGQQVGNRSGSEGLLDDPYGLVHAAVKRAKLVAMGRKAERTGVQTPQRIHRVDHLQDGDCRSRACQAEAAVLAALSLHEPAPS